MDSDDPFCWSEPWKRSGASVHSASAAQRKPIFDIHHKVATLKCEGNLGARPEMPAKQSRIDRMMHFSTV